VFRTKKSKEKHAAQHKDGDSEDESLIDTKIQCTICNVQFNSSTIKVRQTASFGLQSK
jgi:hypothetical protein